MPPLFQDLVIHVIDRSNPDYWAQHADVMQNVTTLLDKPVLDSMILVYNKIDLVEQ